MRLYTLIPLTAYAEVSSLYALFSIFLYSLDLSWRSFLRGIVRLHLGTSRKEVLLD